MPRIFWVFTLLMAAVSCSPEDNETLLLREPQNNTLQASDNAPNLIVPFNDNCIEVTFDLIAGRKEVAGRVHITNNDANLIITYSLNEGWYLLAAKIYADPFSELPLNKGGNPKIGQFPYKFIFLKPRTEFQFTVPLNRLTLDDLSCLSVATFAELFTDLPQHKEEEEEDDEDDAKEREQFVNQLSASERQTFYKKYRFESAWAGDKDFSGSSIARYFEFCPTDCKQFTILNCEQSYMLADLSFIEMGLTDTRWGWAQEVQTQTMPIFSKPLYKRAVLNNLNQAEVVGSVSVNVVGNRVKIAYAARPGFSFSKTDVYLSDEPPTQFTPDTFPYRNRHNNITDFEYDLEYSGDGDFWLIAHAQSCEER